MSQSTRVVVRRGSQVHQTFQTGFAQITPVTRASVTNTTPTSPADRARPVPPGAFLEQVHQAANEYQEKARKDIRAMGT